MWPAIVEREAVVLDRAAPAADAVVLLEQQRVLAQVVRGAQAGRARRRRRRPVRRRGCRPAARAGARRAAVRPAAIDCSSVDHRAAAVRVPRGAGQHVAHLRPPRPARSLGRRGQRALAGRDELLGRVAEVDDVAVRLGHVGDRRADDRLLGRHVFQRLGRADEAASTSLRANGSRQTSQPARYAGSSCVACAARSNGCSDGAAAWPGRS